MQKRTKSSVTIFLLLIFAVCSTQALANGKRLLDKETFMDMESVSNAAISPDGKQIVFTRTWVDKMKDQYRSNLWIVETDGSRPRELTHGNWRDSLPVWSPDGRRIAFISDRDTTSQLHVLWVDTREIAQLTHLERTPANLRWSNDGKQIAFTMLRAGQRPYSFGEAARAASRLPSGRSPPLS